MPPSTSSSVLRKRCGPSESPRNCSRVVTESIGCAGSAANTAARIAGTRASGSPSVRTTSDTGVTATLFWSNGTYTVGAGGWLKPTSLTSPTTPTTVSKRGLVPRWMRRPSGSSPGQCCSGEQLADHRDRRLLDAVAGGEVAAAQQRNPHAC